MGYVTINCFLSFRTINTILEWIPAAVSRNPTKSYNRILTTHPAPPTEMSVIYAFISSNIIEGIKAALFVFLNEKIWDQ